MLTLEQKNSNEIKFMELLTKLNIDLTEITKLLDRVDYFNKPASAQYNGAYPGGLCEYALRFAHELGILCNAYFPGRYSEEDVIKIALFKDIYRATMYEQYQKSFKDDTGEWVNVLAFRTKDSVNREVFGDLGFSSYMQIRDLVPLTTEQVEAIVSSRMSDFGPDIYEVFKSYPLVALTRMADMAALYIN